jgi:hypothetical protein
MVLIFRIARQSGPTPSPPVGLTQQDAPGAKQAVDALDPRACRSRSSTSATDRLSRQMPGAIANSAVVIGMAKGRDPVAHRLVLQVPQRTAHAESSGVVVMPLLFDLGGHSRFGRGELATDQTDGLFNRAVRPSRSGRRVGRACEAAHPGCSTEGIREELAIGTRPDGSFDRGSQEARRYPEDEPSWRRHAPPKISPERPPRCAVPPRPEDRGPATDVRLVAGMSRPAASSDECSDGAAEDTRVVPTFPNVRESLCPVGRRYRRVCGLVERRVIVRRGHRPRRHPRGLSWCKKLAATVPEVHHGARRRASLADSPQSASCPFFSRVTVIRTEELAARQGTTPDVCVTLRLVVAPTPTAPVERLSSGRLPHNWASRAITNE